jgi:hypothetical protein
MRNIIAGLTVLGSLAVGMGTPAAAANSSPMALTGLQAPGLTQVDCNSHCLEHRREVHEREVARERQLQHERREESHRFDHR